MNAKTTVNIPDIPDINQYSYLRTAYKDRKLIIFVGAGLSAIWGCKRWRDMALSLMEYCHRKETFEDYWVYKNLLSKNNTSPRKLIAIAQDKLSRKDYKKSIEETIKDKKDKSNKYLNLFSNLHRLRNAIFITTNIDEHLSGCFSKERKYSASNDFTMDNLAPGNIFHLHGIISQPESMVLTVDEYVNRYKDQNIKTFLENVFFDNTYYKLFIGYEVDEIELIDYMAIKYSDNKNSSSKSSLETIKENRLNILLPFFERENVLLKYEEDHFKRINMKVVPYAIDKRGYDQIYYVIEAWMNVLLGREDDFYKNIELIDKYL